MTDEARRGPSGPSPEVSRLVEARFVEVVGASTSDEFARAISKRTMPLLRDHVRYIHDLNPAGYVVGPKGRVSFVEIADKYLEEMEQRPGGLFFGEEDLKNIWDELGEIPFGQATDQIMISLYWQAFSERAVDDMIYGPPQIFFGGLVDLLHFPDPQRYPSGFRERALAYRLVQLVRKAAFRKPGVQVPKVLFDIGLMLDDVEKMKGGIYNFIVPPWIVASFMSKFESFLTEPERALLYNGKDAETLDIVLEVQSGRRQSLN